MTDEEEFQECLREASEALVRIRRGEAPTAQELAAAPRLDFWAITAIDGYLALSGVVTNHPTLPEGANILTSPLLWLSDDCRTAKTVSRFYRLGVRLDETPTRET